MSAPVLQIAALPLLLVLAGCQSKPHHTGPITGNSFAIDHVRVFDGTGNIDDATVVVRNGLIEAVEPELPRSR